MGTIKHFNWEAKEFGRGRVAVAIEGDRIQIAQLAGNAPPAHPRFLTALVTDDEYAGCQNAHERRVNPWCIEKRVGMSGAIDLRLRVLENAALEDAPIKNVLHVSMNGKLNQGYRGWLGDFWALMEFWPLAEESIEFSVEESPVFIPADGWTYPDNGTQEEYVGSAALALLAGIGIEDGFLDAEYAED